MNFSLCVLLIAIEEIKKKQMKKKTVAFFNEHTFFKPVKRYLTSNLRKKKRQT